MKVINANVAGTPTDRPTLTLDNGQVCIGHLSDQDTRCMFLLSDDAPTGNGGTVRWGQEKELRILIPPYGAWEMNQPPVKPSDETREMLISYEPAIHSLRANGDCFMDATGAKKVLGLATDFKQWKMTLEGQDITGLRKDRRAAGCQGSRVFGTCVNLFHFDPRDYANYYDALPLYARLLAADGEYLHYTACTDVHLMKPGFNVQEHANRSYDVLRNEPNVVIWELVNEYFKNGVDPSTIFRPSGDGPPISAGSFVDGQFAPAHWGDVLTFHPSRSAEKWDVTVPQTVQEIRAHDGQVPVWIGEPIGAAAAPRGDRSTDSARFEKLGVACGVYAAGGVFHSDAGLNSEPWSEIERQCAAAFFRGVHR